MKVAADFYFLLATREFEVQFFGICHYHCYVAGAIESAIERNELTDHIVALAPMAGYDLWLKACSAFAQQLAGEGFHLHAANYLMACNKVGRTTSQERFLQFFYA